VPMVFLNLRSGSKAGLVFRNKHASRRRARARFPADSRRRTRVAAGIAGDKWRKALRNGCVRWREATLYCELTVIGFQDRAHVVDGKVDERPDT
jgi:hypothetical protein